MSNKIKISSVILALQIFGQTNSNFLEKESNYRKPTNRIELERNNVVNKGVWIRNKFRENNPSGKLEEFIFRANSLDADNVMENDFNGFSPVISSYVERNRRSAGSESEKRHRKGVSNCTSKNCVTSNNSIDKSFIQSKLITNLKPTSVFNDYPFEIAVLLDSTRKQLERAKKINNILTKDNRNSTDDADNDNSSTIEPMLKDNEEFKDMYNVTGDGSTGFTPKRSMKDFESKLIKKIELIEEINATTVPSGVSKVDRHVFDKDVVVWHQNAPIDNTRLKVVPKLLPKTNKPITERGLLKVLSMLTKTFKKIMRQHDDIKETHKKMHNMNQDFLKSVEAITEKFKDFDTKYDFLMKCNERLKVLEDNFKSKEQYFKAKEMEMSRNLIEFENQQKKFLSQQRQFYNIQKLMLAQNEKISSRQNIIAKTQSEISHRQNNFARILKKAKQMYIDNHPLSARINAAIPDIDSVNKTEDSGVTHTTTNTPPVTESVKINLFSIPTVMRLENQDHLLLNEKDEQPVDDLVYKYYFNNTFIDNLIKNKILASFVSNGENTEPHNGKNKRNEVTEMQTTLLLPVNKATDVMEQLIGQNLNRRRRWINHHSQRKSKRRNRGKGNGETAPDDSVKYEAPANSLLEIPAKPTVPKELKDIDLSKHSPFFMMATSFCNGIGQNENKQVLDWCIEKALRRLQSIDTRMPSTAPGTKHVARPQRMNDIPNQYTRTLAPVTQTENPTKPVDLRGPRFGANGLGGLALPSGVPQASSVLPDIALTESRLPSLPVIDYAGSERLQGLSGSRGPSRLSGPWLTRVLGSAGQAGNLQNSGTTVISEATIPIYSTTSEPMQNRYESMTTVWSPPTQNFNMFFPDNDQLESNLQKYELKPDVEGNVYFDGSLHVSEMMADKDSGGFSDIMQLESNSRIEVDPATFDLQAKRRAFLRKIGGMV